ncbi:E3 ubiquitin-protein ligase RNF8-like [Patiria miniata]|uniref:E3 ubiquitin-protein ligase CHFR n=1 Tax=Patiria miniata TaxID=46514 RepID=A0A914A025_PATMI|nr:E3 ubiquitin-protein ligase RNF8-like [Patiria miniata]
MTTTCEWCLRRYGSQSKKYAVIPLPSGTEVTLGRGQDVTVMLLPKKNPLMLSRKHAIFKETARGQWAVIDNKSLNGVHVNSSRIKSLEPHVLRNGDHVQLGVVAVGEDQAEFVFTLTQESFTPEDASQILDSYSSQRNRGAGGRTDSRKESQESQRMVCKRTSESNDGVAQGRIDQEEKKRKMGTYPATNTDRNENPGPSSGSPSAKRTKLSSATEQELSATLLKEKRLAEKKVAESEEQFKELTRMLAVQQSARELLEKQLKQKEQDISRELESEKEELENKKKQLQEEMEKAVLQQVQQKEQKLQQQLQQQQDALADEKLALEKKLKDEWEKRLLDQEKQLHAVQAEMKSTLEAQVQEKEAIMMEQLKAQREELLKEKMRVENSLQEEWSKKLEEKDKTLGKMQEELNATLEEEIRKKEEMMLQQLQTQREALQNEKAKVELSLQKELERKLEEKDKDLQAGLEREKAKLEEVIANKEREYGELQTELTASRLEKEAQEVCIQKAKEEALQNITDVMENELQCSICSELFIKATTLNCSHSFCNFCIESWMKRKRECPVCRAAITSHNHSIVLDNYIDKMVERLSEEMKQRRKEIVQERKIDSANPRPLSPIPIEISSEIDSEEIDHSDIDHSEEVENSEEDEDEDEDYGFGWGRRNRGGACFNCGESDHWVRQCPYR